MIIEFSHNTIIEFYFEIFTNQQKNMAQKSLQELAVEYDLNGSELMAVSNYLISIRITKKAVSPQKAINIINNFHKIECAINQLTYLTK